MVEVAEIVRLHGPEYLAKFGDRMPPSHIRTMRDIQACRTETLGGQLYVCDTCEDYRYSYHSCKNRHCPKCGNHQADEWLDEQSSLLLPVPYFMVTFTLPQELRRVARSNQRVVYNILFRAKLRDQLQKVGLLGQVDPKVWNKDWVVHSEPVGTGEAAFKYLAPYISESRPQNGFRVAISNNRIVKLENGTVTFEYTESATDRVRTCEVSAEEFIRRFLQHVLPDRFVKVRYYGLLSPSNRIVLNRVRLLLGSPQTNTTAGHHPSPAGPPEPLLCPKCKTPLRWLAALSPAAWNRKPP